MIPLPYRIFNRAEQTGLDSFMSEPETVDELLEQVIQDEVNQR